MRDLLDLIRDNIFIIKNNSHKKIDDNQLVFVILLEKITQSPFYNTSDSSTNHLTLKELVLCD